MLSSLARPDFSRHAGLLDHALLAARHVAVIGVGGAAGLVLLLTRCGIGRFTLVDPDVVSPTNPATQAHDVIAVGSPKVDALAARILAINPAATVTALPTDYESLDLAEQAIVLAADLMLAMTDRFATQAAINRKAIAAKTDALFAICYPDAIGVEITATFADAIDAGNGCHRCHTKSRYDAYAAGFENPALIPSHAPAAEHLNALLGLLAVARLHQRAGSALPIARLAERFADAPCLISRLDPAFYADPGAPFADVPDALALFATKQWALDTPATWICPDCGTAGRIGQMREVDPRSPQPATEERTTA